MVTTISKIKIYDRLWGQYGGCASICTPQAIYLTPIELQIDDGLCTGSGDSIGFCPADAPDAFLPDGKLDLRDMPNFAWRLLLKKSSPLGLVRRMAAR